MQLAMKRFIVLIDFWKDYFDIFYFQAAVKKC